MKASYQSVMSTHESSRMGALKIGVLVRRQRSQMSRTRVRARAWAWLHSAVYASKKQKDGSQLFCRCCQAKISCAESLSSHETRCLPLVRKIRRNNYGKSESSDEEDENTIVWRFCDAFPGSSALSYAKSGIQFLNQLDDGKKYELVRPGPFVVAGISHGPIVHDNFLAKAQDIPGAQVETFFTQIRKHRRAVVNFCVSLGPSHELPCWSRANLQGCLYCRGLVHHPAPSSCEKLLLGNHIKTPAWLLADWYGENYVEEASDPSGDEPTSEDASDSSGDEDETTS